ncbi:expressed unknown protein [Seminavis robusta]|uniref:SGNH/GDSL hydrolase family protein n=1 Tax=Seminavis robusta TaxID=568900 RepID=A0A9N8EC15_9STRA|nr:expressed unknown protein [Seminavis robusta]|eukprot:Sro783_g201920.1 n/a (351) ;mRNA; f:32549-33601
MVITIGSSTSISSSSWTTSLFSLVLAGLSLAVAASLAIKSPTAKAPNDNHSGRNARRIRIACLGNSIQYYNDCPRLLERMLQEAAGGYYDEVYQNSCLRGGASIISLWEQGNGMRNKFRTHNALRPDGSYDIGAPTVKSLLEDKDHNKRFDFVVINDHTQSPAREASRTETVNLLKEDYVPLMVQSGATPVFLQTAAYRKVDIRGTSDLGDFDHYTKLLTEGYLLYKEKVDQAMKELNPLSTQSTRIAPVGLAYARIYHSDQELWKQLYDGDNFHPSPHGTLLQAFVLYITMTQQEPPTSYDAATWWERARRMQPPLEFPLPLPTKDDAEVLRKVAIDVCQTSNLLAKVV